ncbi:MULTISPECIES: phosphatase PAP2 family protein [Shewanella]|uniref:undecaprenyl-diphosphate phosphatase n=1 Tax=Shewanella sedimentimangrovi TaxID=2814293 RepID=A0ABX7R1B3_9GAMM|nr:MULTISPECIES: phosphatase PAP2 family protein [Shewanella]QSX36883.1 phosphatase PAP2 family protein [Shewanella sedimentimangrovi]QSX40495.1 phosphatase PAP2 family protein [Shewanella cyperi]
MKDKIAELDKRGYRLIVDISREHGLEPLALRISASGDGPLYLYLFVGLLLTHSQGQSLFNLALVAFLIELPLYLLLKHSIRRTRPCHLAIGGHCRFEPSDKFSLPSGHTAAAFVMAASVQHIYPQLAAPAFLWALAVGLSRIALGVHFPLDIGAGALLGLGSVLLASHYI